MVYLSNLSWWKVCGKTLSQCFYKIIFISALKQQAVSLTVDLEDTHYLRDKIKTV